MSKPGKISFGCDHGGLALRDNVLEYLKKAGYEVIDHGTTTADAVDYPDYAAQVARDVSLGLAEKGVLVCGTGIGMAITAGKFKGVRAAALTDVASAAMTRRHNDLNVLCLGGRVLTPGVAELILETFLKTPFEGGRHENRVRKISQFEGET